MIEAEQIALCQRNDRKAQRYIYESYYGRMMGLCLRYAKNATQASDMLNQGFLKVYSSISSYKNHVAFESWIKDLFVSHAVQYLKSIRQEYYVATTARAEEKRHDLDLFHQAGDEDPNIIGNDGYVKALQQLPPSFRSVFNMNVIDGYSLKQIADTLEISEETSKLNLEKARYSLFRNIQLQQKGY
ncbi:MAG: RNA polymerase sigma factor [Bacteroidia bacterium]